MRAYCGVGGGGLVEEGHDIVTVTAIEYSCDPRWIGWAGEGNCGEQDQRHNRKECRDCSPPCTWRLSPWRRLPQTRAWTHPWPPHHRPAGGRTRGNSRRGRPSLSRGRPAV